MKGLLHQLITACSHTWDLGGRYVTCLLPEAGDLLEISKYLHAAAKVIKISSMAAANFEARGSGLGRG